MMERQGDKGYPSARSCSTHSSETTNKNGSDEIDILNGWAEGKENLEGKETDLAWRQPRRQHFKKNSGASCRLLGQE